MGNNSKKKKDRANPNPNCSCCKCTNLRKMSGKGRAWDCQEPNIHFDPGNLQNHGAPSAGKAPPAMGGGATAAAAAAVTAGGGQEVTTFGNPVAGARTARIEDAAVAAATACGGQELADTLRSTATFGHPTPGQGAPPTPPRPPPQDGDQAPGRRNDDGGGVASAAKAARATPPEEEDAVEVAPASPPRSPAGAAAAGPAALLEGDATGRVFDPDRDWGFNGLEPRGPPGGDAQAAGPTGGTAERVANTEVMANYGLGYGLYEESADNFVGESIETDSMASLSDGRSPEYVRGKDGRLKVKWPRRNGRKVRSPFGPDYFPYLPVDPPDESMKCAADDKKEDNDGFRDEKMEEDSKDAKVENDNNDNYDAMGTDIDDDGYTADTEWNRGG